MNRYVSQIDQCVTEVTAAVSTVVANYPALANEGSRGV